MNSDAPVHWSGRGGGCLFPDYQENQGLRQLEGATVVPQEETTGLCDNESDVEIKFLENFHPLPMQNYYYYFVATKRVNTRRGA